VPSKWLMHAQYIPYILALGAVLLFSLGYISHMMLGANNAIEEISEQLLQKEYNIQVEFSAQQKI
jgi:hypothetical protein